MPWNSVSTITRNCAMKMIFKIGKTNWSIIRVKLGDGFKGWCYKDEKIILVDSDLKGSELRYVTLHETLHALNWSKREKSIEQATIAITEALDAVSK